MNVYVGHWHTNSSPPPPPSLTIDPHSVTWTHQTPPHKKIPPIPIRPPHQLITTTLNYPKLEVAPKIPKPPSLIFLSKHCKKSDWRNCELWVGLHAGNGATLLVGIWWRENKNDLVEWKALVDTVRIKSADLKDDFYSRVLRLIELPVVGERPQTAIPSSQFSDFVVYVVTTLISPKNQRQCASFLIDKRGYSVSVIQTGHHCA